MPLLDITADHVRQALPEIDREGINNRHRGLVANGYELLVDGKVYSPKYVISIAHKYVNGQELSPNVFGTKRANNLLQRLGFTVRRSNDPVPSQAGLTKFTWIPFYRELCTRILQSSPAELTDVVKRVLQVQHLMGLKDQDESGNPVELTEFDPYTFLSFISRGAVDKRLTVLARLKEWLVLSSPVPTDLNGLYTIQNDWIWLFGYSYERQPNDIPELRELYHQVESDTVSADLFNQVLQITRLSPAKLSHSLFTHRPDQYFPVGSRTKDWLAKRSLPVQFQSFDEYDQLMDAIRQVDSRPFYVIVDEANREVLAAGKTTVGEAPQVQTNSSGFTWVPYYRELSDKLYQYAPANLIHFLRGQNIDGLRDKGQSGPEFDLVLDDLDPYTFLSFINKFGDTKRLDLLRQLGPALEMSTPAPIDVDGVPTAQAQSVWLFGYKFKRQPDDIDKLKALYRQVQEDALTATLFEDVLKIYKVGPAKLTEVLFYQKPDKYLPINGQTKPWLKKRGLPFRYETFAEYQQILDAVRKHDPRTFYEISREAYLENTGPGTSAQVRYYCVGTTFGDQGDQLPRFVKDGIWQNGHGDEKEKYLELIKSIPVGSRLAAKSSFVQGPRTAAEGVLRIKGIGEVTRNVGDGQYLEVVWDEDFEPFQLIGKAPYRKTIQQVTRPEDIQLIFFHEPDQPTETMSFPITIHAKNTILYGPPGTGKTYGTIDVAVEIADGRKDPAHPVNKDRFDVLRKEGQIEFVTFHQNYTYEDFVTGLKPDVDGDDLKFQRSYGVFYRMAQKARDNYEASLVGTGAATSRPFQEVFEEFMKPLVEEGEEIKVKMASGIQFVLYDLSERSISFRKLNGSTLHTLSIGTLRRIYEGFQEISPNGLKPYYRPLLDKLSALGHQVSRPVAPKNYVLVIDEINRANMSRVFGELITLLEDDKRLGGENALTVTLSSGESFSVPPNLYLIGTMNTADKSLALLDVALRRRFEFIGKYPDYTVVDGRAKGVLERLNKAILAHHKPADFLIGHAYFIGKQPDQLPGVFNNRIIPLLMEYFNGRTDLVKTLLADAGIKSERDSFTDQLTVTNVE